ncbi:MAG TPA: HAMP domain-containing sensor histidine kinase [Acidimicrobiia bacterium]
MADGARTADHAYRGRDRRAVPVDVPLPVGRLCLGVAVVAALWGGVIVTLRDAGLSAPVFALPVVRLDVGASLLASVSAAACFLRWRLDGIASAFWAGLVVLVLGLSGFLSSDVTRAYGAAGIACSVVAVGLAAAWLRGFEVDATLSVRKVLSVGLVALVVAFAVARIVVAHGLAGVALSAGIGAALVGVAFAGHVMWSRDQWMVVVLAAYGASLVVYAALPVTDPLRAAAASSLHLMAMGIAAFGSTLLLHEAAARQREAAFRSRVERDEAQERFADTLHEVRSTVTALEGGVRTFEPVDDDPAREVLSRALVAEIQRLRALVDDRPAKPEAETFWLCEVLEPMLTVCVAAGWVVSWDIPADLRAVGRSADVAQVVHALLTNAHRHAPGSEVDVAVGRAGDFALIRVEDRGPGIAPAHRETVFARGERGDAPADCEGTGLGLHIARTIARAEGGDLWVEERSGGGASFVLTVPTVTVLHSAMREGDRAAASVWSHPLGDHSLQSAQ